jgi:Polyketide cyclase / dehydrase and lipid transport
MPEAVKHCAVVDRQAERPAEHGQGHDDARMSRGTRVSDERATRKRLLAPTLAGAATGLALRRAYRLLASGALTLDLDIGRRLQPLGPVDWTIAAAPELVFDVVAAPYFGKTPRALADKLQVWERGSDLVLAAHFTQVKCGTTTTLETVRFERPHRIDFRLVRGPVPHLVESFLLEASDHGTEFRWQGELGTDGWQLGELWGRIVARAWTRAVEDSVRQIAAEAERRACSAAGVA